MLVLTRHHCRTMPNKPMPFEGIGSSQSHPSGRTSFSLEENSARLPYPHPITVDFIWIQDRQFLCYRFSLDYVLPRTWDQAQGAGA